MQPPRLTSVDRFILAKRTVLFFFLLSLLVAGCSAIKHTPHRAVGPTKQHYQSQPKFQ